VDQISNRLNELGPRDRKIVVYCRSGVRSRRAQEILKEAGFSGVYNLGGMGRW
jgi:phage shock protein E